MVCMCGFSIWATFDTLAICIPLNLSHSLLLFELISLYSGPAMICYRMQLFSDTDCYWAVILFIISVSVRCIVKIKG